MVSKFSPCDPTASNEDAFNTIGWDSGNEALFFRLP